MALSPRDLSLPDKFASFRPAQESIALDIALSSKRFRFMDAPVGFGKCHPAGTKILLHDGGVKNVEDVCVGDLLMGPDSLPRTVLETHSGYGDLFEVCPVKGESWQISSNHTLTLVRTNCGKKKYTGSLVDVDVSDFLSWSSYEKSLHKLIRVGVEFQQTKNDLPIPPYILGVMLGDGNLAHHANSVCKPDQEIVDALSEFAAAIGCSVSTADDGKTHAIVGKKSGQFSRWNKNPIKLLLNQLGLDQIKSQDRHVPNIYRVSSGASRAQLLAGLLDTDGSWVKGGYDFISKSEQLARDVVFVARSLGLAAYLTTCVKSCQNGFSGTYYRVGISGDCTILPLRIARKKPRPRLQKKDVLRTGFSLRRAGVGHYYGFSVDSDHRYLLGDFTVTHNSATYCAVSRLLDARTLVLVGTKGLQNQLMDDFASMGMKDVRGQANYRCKAASKGGVLESYGGGKPFVTCDDGPCKVGVKCPFRREPGCDYYDAVRSANKASIVVSNYALWLSLALAADPYSLGEFDLLVMDEAHDSHTWLSEFCAVELRRSEVKHFLSLVLPNVEEGLPTWRSWANTAAGIARGKKTQLKQQLDDLDNQFPRPKDKLSKTLREIVKLNKLLYSLEQIALSDTWKRAEDAKVDVRMPGKSVDWVQQPTDDGVKFTPLWAHGYAEKVLFRGIPNVVLASATLTPIVRTHLGIPESESSWHSAPSSFAVKRRPFYYIPTTRVDNKMVEGQKRQLMNRIDNFIADRLDWKGIIHTVSYARAKEVVERSRHAKVMMTHDRNNFRERLEKFKSSPAPAIFVSPSIVEGHDFKDDLARWAIIMKVPFADGRDPVFKARCKSDNGYRSYVAALKLMQMAGRIVRSENDWGEIVLFDEHFGWFKNTTPFPKWFRETWRVQHQLPPPLGDRLER